MTRSELLLDIDDTHADVPAEKILYVALGASKANRIGLSNTTAQETFVNETHDGSLFRMY